MNEKSTSKIAILFLLASCLLVSLFFPSTVSGTSAGTSTGTSLGTSGTNSTITSTPVPGPAIEVDMNDSNLVTNINNGVYKNQTLTIIYTDSNSVISKELADALQNQGSFVFKSSALSSAGDYILWNFPNGYPLEGFNLGVSAKTADQITDPAYQTVASIVKNDKAVFLDFSYSGDLAAPVELVYNQGSLNYLNNNNVAAYFCKPNSISPELIAQNISEATDGYHFTVTHFSIYMLKNGLYTAPNNIVQGNQTTTGGTGGNSSKSSFSVYSSSSTSTNSNYNDSNYNPSTGPADTLAISSAFVVLASVSTVIFLGKKK